MTQKSHFSARKVAGYSKNSSEKLAIELDGQPHFSDRPGLNDQSKREYAESQGIRVIRFENKRFFEDTEWVLDVIRSNFHWSAERTTPSSEADATPPS